MKKTIALLMLVAFPLVASGDFTFYRIVLPNGCQIIDVTAIVPLGSNDYSASNGRMVMCTDDQIFRNGFEP